MPYADPAFRAAHRKAWRHTPLGAYCAQKDQARQRRIEWTISFDEWWSLWLEKWAQRGRTKGKYVMARNGDTGPYAMGNVRIITFEDNCHERERIKKERANALH